MTPAGRRLPFADRREAGRALAADLAFLRDAPGLLVLALPRGGVPVAWEVARALQAPLDVFVVRKIGMPGHPEYALGAIASGGLQVLDSLPAGAAQRARVEAVIREETAELARRERAYRGGRPPLEVAGRTVVLVDDGVATGASLEVAARAVRQLAPRELVVAAPLASAAAARRLAPWADRAVFSATPEPFDAVSRFYREFPQCEDDEVRALLAEAPRPAPRP
ncbi:phosphoribosyltransferase [Ramlibacter sp. MAHUQ-53]|uniref:phosphoribosyltransferase n=1 Tax=unclassified Ramlibacter TaxID=2617605 RepID=UPI003633C352